jgi:UDP-N-acetyl-D-mannosaminuronic acid dehydrogenase
MEAELAKLFSNTWRYITFAIGNQFYMTAADHGLNYHNIYKAMVTDYERNKDLPRPGFAAGPCLLKDTMQLAAFNNNNFFLGHAAMLVNEGFPSYIIEKLLKAVPDLHNKTIGILGMAFKAESDDARDSLSYKLKKIAATKCRAVLCHDFYVKDASFSSLEDTLEKSDILILGAPHKDYAKIDIAKYKNKILGGPEIKLVSSNNLESSNKNNKLFVDVWNFWKK